VNLRPPLLLLALLFTPTLAAAQTAAPTFSIRNDTRSLVRCMLLEGGPITQLVAIRPGRAHVERVAPGQAVSLACPGLHETFGPFAPGRYAFRSAKRKTEVVRLP
jgi:hypothetical protein